MKLLLEMLFDFVNYSTAFTILLVQVSHERSIARRDALIELLATQSPIQLRASKCALSLLHYAAHRSRAPDFVRSQCARPLRPQVIAECAWLSPHNAHSLVSLRFAAGQLRHTIIWFAAIITRTAWLNVHYFVLARIFQAEVVTFDRWWQWCELIDHLMGAGTTEQLVLGQHRGVIEV